MVDHWIGFAAPQRHVERIKHELATQVRGHRPTDDASAPDVQHDRHEQEASPGEYVSDICDPQLVRCSAREVALDQIGSRPCIAIAPRGATTLTPANADDAVQAHQPCHPVVADAHTQVLEVGMYLGCSVDFARALMQLYDLLPEERVASRSCRRCAFAPRIVPAGGDLQHAAHGGDAIGGLMRLHEREDLEGAVSVSRANQAVAFDKISRSSRSCLFSLRSRPNSSRSCVVSPSLRRPPSSSSCLIQLRIVCGDGSNSRARSSMLRPARASSMSLERNSGG